MKAKIDLFYEKHPYLSLLINLLLGSIIGISVEYLQEIQKKINNFKVSFIRRDFFVAYSRY